MNNLFWEYVKASVLGVAPFSLCYFFIGIVYGMTPSIDLFGDLTDYEAQENFISFSLATIFLFILLNIQQIKNILLTLPKIGIKSKCLFIIFYMSLLLNSCNIFCVAGAF